MLHDPTFLVTFLNGSISRTQSPRIRTIITNKMVVWIAFWEGTARKIGRDPVTQANILKISHFAPKVFETISKTRNALPS